MKKVIAITGVLAYSIVGMWWAWDHPTRGKIIWATLIILQVLANPASKRDKTAFVIDVVFGIIATVTLFVLPYPAIIVVYILWAISQLVYDSMKKQRKNKEPDTQKEQTIELTPSVIKPAGFWIRLLAHILDNLIVNVTLAIAFSAFLPAGSSKYDLVTGSLSFLYFLLVPVFWSGYTIGKRSFGIRIVKINGKRLGVGTMLLRTFVAYIVYILTFGIGVVVSAFMVAIRKDKRAIHDFIAGTCVVYEKP